MLLLMLANTSSLLVCSVLKLPQIITVISAKTARGLSVRSLLLELIGFLIFLTYQTYYEYPLTTYLEYPVLIVQDVILLMCILFYNGNIGTALPYTILFIIGWRLLTIHKLIIDLAMGYGGGQKRKSPEETKHVGCHLFSFEQQSTRKFLQM
ncbi:solute carrier family 66 member 3 isoform X2 [Chiloscyllium punctatum]|uniref:solute carrier family 66 member 3 isoform X2 n=1 Tax=Chiloscyllium punctatum TaxID=137246 RepID=UPI003B63C849